MKTSSPDTTLNWPHLHMIRVPGGTFEMGSASENAYDDEKPVHTVTVSDFELAQFPVTQALWEAVMGEGSDPSAFKGRHRPVEVVIWYKAVAFCNRLNAMEKLPFCYFSDEKCTQPYALQDYFHNEVIVYYKPACGAFRLPTEAEWEYAAKGGAFHMKTEYAGSDRLKDVAWYGENSGEETQHIGLLQPNILGLYDMSGNVLEWCWDWYDIYRSGTQTNPTGPTGGTSRVVRGGSWFNYNDWGLRVSHRKNDDPDDHDYTIGFRVARHLTP